MGDLSNEPSMEDILSSIKKIIAEDAVKGISPRVRPAPKPDKPTPVEPEIQELEALDMTEEDVLELTDLPDAEPGAEDNLVSVTPQAESRKAFDSLAKISAKVEEAVAPSPSAGGSLEDVVREMLRPMLKDWLDANLPNIVRNAVAREVARIAGRDD